LLVAERVETQTELTWCQEAGFDLFQGFFLERPETITRGRAPEGSRLAALQIMTVLNDPRASADQLEEAISRDVTLSYRLLRLINSAAYGVASPVDSLHRAIVYLGRDTVRAWVTLLLLSGMNGKPNELLTKALISARMCERLAATARPDDMHACFTVGLFSVLDAVLDTPMAELVTHLPLAPAVSRALTHGDGPVGELLTLTRAYERCAWSELSAPRAVTDSVLREAYLDALRWTRRLDGALAA
jgi:EAL and modified HD-GYP domain-containing signal transduction protein